LTPGMAEVVWAFVWAFVWTWCGGVLCVIADVVPCVIGADFSVPASAAAPTRAAPPIPAARTPRRDIREVAWEADGSVGSITVFFDFAERFTKYPAKRPLPLGMGRNGRLLSCETNCRFCLLVREQLQRHLDNRRVFGGSRLKRSPGYKHERIIHCVVFLVVPGCQDAIPKR
jgi:hypothetical protein